MSNMTRQQAACLLKALKAYLSPKKPQEPSSLCQEMLTGSTVGMLACALAAATSGWGGTAIALAAMSGICAGALIGFVLWIGSDGIPDEHVVPPAHRMEEQPETRHRHPPPS